MQNRNRKLLGDLLVESGSITEEQRKNLLVLQKTSGKKLGEVIIDEGILDEEQIIEMLEFQLRIPRFDFNSDIVEPEMPKLINENLARKYIVIPARKEDNKLIVVMSDPLDLSAIDHLKLSTGLEIRPALALKGGILNAIDRYYGKESAEQAVEDFKKQYNIDQLVEEEIDDPSDISSAPVVRLVNSLILHAIKVNASDIHIEPLESTLKIRFRVDGELQEIMRSSKAAHPAMVTRIKIMSKLDIAEKRIPQDGRMEMAIDGKDIDFRVSVLPTVYGEKVVLRLLGRSNTMLTKTQLGFSSTNIALFDKIIKSPHGIILVTGPTGSGKTTTLYAVLNELNKANRNIITVEDPVEYRLEGINQVQVNTKAGLTFASGLRSILRQDPDIIMVGEIRDSETAQIAVRAAITGHLVLSTIHTNDSASTISRLIDMGVEHYLVSSSLVGVVSQRLVKKICSHCKKPYKPDLNEMSLLKLRESQPLFKGTGCSACGNTGYRGRTAIHEVMLVGKDIRELIERRGAADQIKLIASKTGTISLRDSCTRLVLEGKTTVEELLRITYSID